MVKKKEIYNLNIELKSCQNQIKYFTDNTKIKTISGLSNGEKNEIIKYLDIDFIVANTKKMTQKMKQF